MDMLKKLYKFSDIFRDRSQYVTEGKFRTEYSPSMETIFSTLNTPMTREKYSNGFSSSSSSFQADLSSKRRMRA